MPTSYGHFLDYIWQNIDKIQTDLLYKNLVSVNYDHIALKSFSNYETFCTEIKHDLRFGTYRFIEGRSEKTLLKIQYIDRNHYNPTLTVFQFENKLFQLITESNADTWVDIEKIYYNVLLSIVKSEESFVEITSIDQLNSEFLQIKNLLHQYLNEKVDTLYSFTNELSQCKSMMDIFSNNYFHKEDQKKYFLEFPNNYRSKIISWNMYQKPNLINQNPEYIVSSLFLDFNYTSNVSNYLEIFNKIPGFDKVFFSRIQIHGKLNDDENPINFGFGDEMDDHYKILEKTGDNRYLENIKSFMYFNNLNYRNLLNWIEIHDYQIFILGHSCGLSDRTLLNTLFEHNNCKSIKIFYHEYDDGTDNFTELTQNISRHFNKKDLMREKVVNKSLSKPLPQNVRYKFKNS